MRMRIPLVIFLHFYQPPTQLDDILERIVFESYRPVLSAFLKNGKAHATFNFPAGLAKLLTKAGFGDVVDNIRQLVARGQVELTGTAAYHAFLPLLPTNEIKRQILLNEEGLTRFFGRTARIGFFPPELTFSNKLAREVNNLGFKWMAIPMISLGDKIPEFRTLYKLYGANLYLFPRHKWASAVILSGQVRTRKSFLEWLKNEKPVGFILTIMDAETFGHHRPGLENLLEELIQGREFETLKVSDLFGQLTEIEEVKPREACWSNEEQDFWLDKERKIVTNHPFLLWKDPQNPIHSSQWKLTRLAIKTVNGKSETVSQKKWQRARSLLDEALSSDQYWWASGKPWWSLEMVEVGAYNLVKVIYTATKPGSKARIAADNLYKRILDQAFFWQRSGFIRRQHRQAAGNWINVPFKIRAPVEWYNQIILEFEDEMKKAARNLEFEKAIKWRDAIYKLNTGSDVFDVLHVVDELQAIRKIPSLKPLLLQENSEISKFAKRYFQKLAPQEVEEGKRRLRQQSQGNLQK